MTDETTLPAFVQQPPMFETGDPQQKSADAIPERPKGTRRKRASPTDPLPPPTLNVPPKKPGRPKGVKNKVAAAPAGTSDLGLALKAAAGLKELELDLFVKIVDQFDTVPKASRAKVASALVRMYAQ